MSCLSMSCSSGSGRKQPCTRRSPACAVRSHAVRFHAPGPWQIVGIATLALATCSPALAGSPHAGAPASAPSHFVVEGAPAVIRAAEVDWPAMPAGKSRALPQRPQAPADASVQDMQALIEATRALVRSTRTTADSIGMDHDRLTGILTRLDRIEAKVRQLDAPSGHPTGPVPGHIGASISRSSGR